MPQVTRALKCAFLKMLPSRARANYLAKHPNSRKAAPEGMRFVFNEYLGKYSVNIDTKYKVERIMWTGAFEKDLLALLKKRIKPGDVCFDIGGNVGAITIALADVVGSEGTVHSFEPEPRNFARLTDNLDLNPELANRVTLNNLGLSDEPGKLFWSEDPGNPGNGMLGISGDVETRVITLDAYAEVNGIDRLDFMKVDVEGMELKVFRGAEKTLRRYRPTIYFETLGRYKAAEKNNFDLIETFLTGCGYALHKLDKHGNLTPSSIRDSGSYTVAVAT